MGTRPSLSAVMLGRLNTWVSSKIGESVANLTWVLLVDALSTAVRVGGCMGKRVRNIVLCTATCLNGKIFFAPIPHVLKARARLQIMPTRNGYDRVWYAAPAVRNQRMSLDAMNVDLRRSGGAGST